MYKDYHMIEIFLPRNSRVVALISIINSVHHDLTMQVSFIQCFYILIEQIPVHIMLRYYFKGARTCSLCGKIYRKFLSTTKELLPE